MSNPVIELMLKRKSVRHFDPAKKIAPEVLEQILKAVQQAPTSCNGQQISVITVQETSRKQKILEVVKGRGGPQQHIVDAPVFLLFVADYHKVGLVMKEAGDKPLEIMETIESVLTAAVDIGICLEAAATAAESLGMGAVCIGALRWNDLAPVVDFMDLPKNTFPLCGLTIGYPTEEGQKTKVKPRLPYSTFVHSEKYHADAYKNFSEILEGYNKEMSAYAGAPTNWAVNLATMYSNPVLGKHLAKNFTDQGFKF